MESRRQLQVASLIQQHFSTVLQNQGSYIYGNALVTVTQVKVSPDQSIARIYFSVYNTEDKEAVMKSLRGESFKLRQELAFRIKKHVRRIPNIEFYRDETLDEMDRLNELFDRIAEEQPDKPSQES